MRRLDGGVAFDPVAQPGIVVAGEMEVMDTDFRRDPFFFQRQHIGKKAAFLFRWRDGKHAAGYMFFRELNGGERRFETGISSRISG